MTELTEHQIIERRWLEVYEERAHKALVMAERGWREFAEVMHQIKDSRSYIEAGYKHFAPYYRERWQPKVGRTVQTVYDTTTAMRVEEEVRQVRQDIVLPDDYRALKQLGAVESSEKKARIVEESLSEPGGFRENVYAKVAEYKGERTIGEALGPDWDKDLPPAGLAPEQKVSTEVGALHTFLYRLNPEAVVDAYLAMGPSNDLGSEIAQVDSLVSWLGRYRDALVARQATPLRAVGGKE